MDLGLAGRMAIITGGSAGLGRAVACFLAAEGGHVGLAARRPDAPDLAVRAINAEGLPGRATAFPMDATNDASVRQAVDAAAALHGRLDILVNGAAAPGGLVRHGIEAGGDAALPHDIGTKAVSYFRATRAAAPLTGGIARDISL